MSSLSPSFHMNILLADDDEDDCFLFKYALDEIPMSFALTRVHDGEELMILLNEENLPLPDVLFLDINMPRINGLECLAEIRSNEKLKNLLVIIFSSSSAPEMLRQYNIIDGQYYVQKPDDVAKYKKAIYGALQLKHTPVVKQPL